MILDLTDTTAAKIASTLVQARRRAGSQTSGAVLTLVVSTEERHHYDAMKAASKAAREHPARIIVAIARPEVLRTRLDAEVRVGDETGPGEVIVLRLYGELAVHADAVVTPLLLPDVPVVTWWPDEGPRVPAKDPLGVLAQRRITDAAECPNDKEMLKARGAGYAPGDTDLAWTRLTPWRSMLAAALDQIPGAKVTGAAVSGEEGNPSARVLALWLRQRLGVPVERTADEGPGITGVHLHTEHGSVSLTRPDGELATLSMPGQPDRPVALKRRDTAELIAEELRRLDPDEVYADVLREVDIPFSAPPKAGGPTVEKAAREREAAVASSADAAVANAVAAQSGAGETAVESSAESATEAVAAGDGAAGENREDPA